MADEQLLQALNKVVDRLDAIEGKLALLETVSQRAPILVDAAATTAGVYFRDAETRGIDLIGRGQRALALAEKASDPDKLDAVEQILERTELIELALQGADAMQTLAAAGALDEELIDFAASATRALRETRSGNVASVGAFGALMKLGDPDIQRAVGFSLAMAKRLGQILGEGTALQKK